MYDLYNFQDQVQGKTYYFKTKTKPSRIFVSKSQITHSASTQTPTPRSTKNIGYTYMQYFTSFFSY